MNFPKQRVSYSDKVKDDFKWAKECIKYLSQARHHENIAAEGWFEEKSRMLANYELFNNQLNQRDFEKECNPMGIEVDQFRDVIQPYNKTSNKIQVLVSEELKRPFDYRAYLTDYEGVRSKLNMRNELIATYIKAQLQQMIQRISSNQINPELIEQEVNTVLEPQEIEKYLKTSYTAKEEILANKLLQYLNKQQGLKDKKNDAFKHALISGYEVIRINEDYDTPSIEIVNPITFFFHKSPDSKFIQDGLYAGQVTFLHPNEIIDRFQDDLTEDDKVKLEKNLASHPSNSHNGSFMRVDDMLLSPSINNARVGQYDYVPSNYWEVVHVAWKALKRVGFIEHKNEYGDTQTDLVSEEFEVPTHAVKYKQGNITYYEWEMLPDLNNQGEQEQQEPKKYKLQWQWLPEIWEGTQIGADIFVNIRPAKNQFRSNSDPYKVKLPYHGCAYSNMNARPISLMDRMKPFQYLYFIIVHKLKKLIAQDQGTLYQFDTTMIDPKIGLEKTLYYLKELNIHFVNPLQNAEGPGAAQRGGYGAQNMSNMSNIAGYIQLMNSIDEQISDVAGVNKQREGQTARAEAVTNAQQNLLQSSLITEVYFDLHNKLWEDVIDSLLNSAKKAFSRNPRPVQYVLDDGSLAMLEMTADLDGRDYGIFVNNSAKDTELFNTLKSLSMALLQADKANFSDIIDLYKANSVEELSNKIKESEANKQAQQGQQMDMQQRMQQDQLQMQQQLKEADQAFELEKQAREHAHEIQKVEIEVFKFQQELDSDNNGVPDPLEVEKFKVDTALQSRKLDIEEKKIEAQKAIASNKTQTAKKK